jgi:hypothetical protein
VWSIGTQDSNAESEVPTVLSTTFRWSQEMFWNLYQQMQISDVQSTTQQARSDAATVRREMSDLRRSIDTLTLTCAALWELLREKDGLSDDELVAKMREIDLRDGKLDGKMTAPTVTCPSCHRPNKSNRQRCIYCGGTLPTSGRYPSEVH